MKKILAVFLTVLFIAAPTFADVWVSGYYRTDGTYVNGYYRSPPTTSTVKTAPVEVTPVKITPLKITPTKVTPIKKASCCKICSTGKACGNSCISKKLNCHKSSGCACNG